MAMEYQGFATLGVNLNRQKYGPLDVSSVFISTADLTYYISKGKTILPELSTYWRDITPYPYAGQIVSLIENNNTKVYILVEIEDGTFEIQEVGGSSSDLTDYATKQYVEELIEGIEIPDNTFEMTPLLEEEILDICK